MKQDTPTLDLIKKHIRDFLQSKGVDNPITTLTKPDMFSHGDVSTNVALRYAKGLGYSPAALAEEIARFLEEKRIAGVFQLQVVQPGFINVFLSDNFFKEMLVAILEDGSHFGKNKSLKGEKWVVEHTSPNPNKAMHLGHLRNNLVGMGLVRTLLWNGADVVSDAVDNNRGIAVAKLMWGFLSHMRKETKTPVSIDYWHANPEQWYTPEERGALPDRFVTQCYVLGEKDFKNNRDVENVVRNLVVQWELGEEKVWELWSHVLGYAYQGMQRTLKRLGNHWDTVWHEHEHYQEGKRYIKIGIEMGVFRRLEDGAVLTDLAEYNLPDTILLKNDGTSLYITQDIALTALKKKYYEANKLLWVIGPEQSLAMKQLFAVCEQLGIGSLNEFTHVPYGYVGLKDGDGRFKKMSSREGTVILIDDVIDVAKDKVSERLKTNGRNQNVNLDDLAEKLALAAVKFGLLKSGREQDLTFDTEESIKVAGDSGVYVLYTYARIQSILDKRQSSDDIKIVGSAQLALEGELVRLLVHFPETVVRAKEDLSTHHIAQYLLEVCSVFNTWYGKEVVLDGSDRESYKLAVVKSAGVVIKNGLSILGIDTINQM